MNTNLCSASKVMQCEWTSSIKVNNDSFSYERQNGSGKTLHYDPETVHVNTSKSVNSMILCCETPNGLACQILLTQSNEQDVMVQPDHDFPIEYFSRSVLLRLLQTQTAVIKLMTKIIKPQIIFSIKNVAHNNKNCTKIRKHNSSRPMYHDNIARNGRYINNALHAGKNTKHVVGIVALSSGETVKLCRVQPCQNFTIHEHLIFMHMSLLTPYTVSSSSVMMNKRHRSQ